MPLPPFSLSAHRLVNYRSRLLDNPLPSTPPTPSYLILINLLYSSPPPVFSTRDLKVEIDLTCDVVELNEKTNSGTFCSLLQCTPPLPLPSLINPIFEREPCYLLTRYSYTDFTSHQYLPLFHALLLCYLTPPITPLFLPENGL